MHRSPSRTHRAASRIAGAALIAGATLAASALPAAAATGSRQSLPDPLATNAAEALQSLQLLRLAQNTGGSPEAVAQARTSYEKEATEVAADVAVRAGGAASDYLAAWYGADDARMTAVYTALAQVGDRYRSRAAGPDAFDCSGLTSFAWAAAGVSLPRSSTAQIRAAEAEEAGTLEPGDLVWRPGHVMLYLGADDAIVHAPQSGRNVEVRSWGRVRKFGDPTA